MSSDDYTFWCCAWSIHDVKCENFKAENVTDKKDEIFKAFKSTIRYKFQISGDITFYRAHNESGTVKTDAKVTDLTQTLYEVISKTGMLVIRYDEKKTVAGGGVGNGANVIAGGARGAFAGGGVGMGGVIDRKGNANGGKAFGGDGRGEKIWGNAGDARGGQANVTEKGAAANAGRGIAGELVND
ncbi:hypothetical protein F5Y04DRAFT_76197 [Hypomontagnella monticulosa]|nr:hypothetical protein F5Y04DRAFT_76197 [Hypomontagnella monticulosa]